MGKKMEKKIMNTFATQWWKWFKYYSLNKNLAGRMVSSLNPLSDILTELERTSRPIRFGTDSLAIGPLCDSVP